MKLDHDTREKAAIPELTPAESPRPIDLADVRAGDRVRWVMVREGVVHDDCLVIESGEHFWLQERDSTLYLLDRPDPDAVRAEQLRDALVAITDPLRYVASIGSDEILAALKAAGLTIEPRPATGDLHA